MSKYAVTTLDEIEVVTDGRSPWRPVRHHLGITAFGVNAWTGKQVGDRIINEHDETAEHDRQEELYLVQAGRRAVRARRRERRRAGRHLRVRAAGREADRVRGRAGDDAARDRRLGGQGVPGLRLRDLDAAERALPGRRVRAGDRAWPRGDRGASGVRGAALQPRVHREPRGPQGRRDRASPAGDRAPGAAPLDGRARTRTSTRSATSPAFQELVAER